MPIAGAPPLVHIGYPKALSSWLQSHLFTPRNGFCTVMDPLATELLLIGPTPFAFDAGRAREWMDSRRRTAADGSALVDVVTSEGLVGNMFCGGFNARTNADRLKTLLPRARVLIVVREQKAAIRSLYKTLVAWGMPLPIGRLLDPLETAIAPQFNLDFLRYDLLVAYYQQLYGRQAVLVLPFEQFLADPAGFVLGILRLCRIERRRERLAKLPLGTRVNPGQTMLNIEIERLRNRFFVSSSFNYSGWFRSTAERHERRLRRMQRNPFPRFMDDWLEENFRRTVAERFSGQFADSNRRLGELTGIEFGALGYEV
jgi:hypothetical protein